MTGPAVASLKLLAQATGEYTRDELNKVAKLGWTDAAAKQIAEAKAAELGGGSSTGSAVARPFRAKETDLKTTETQRHREFCAEIKKNSVTPCLCGEIKLLPYSTRSAT